jgi:hypothetical protein
VAASDFSQALAMRLHVFAAVNSQARVDYLDRQIARIQAKIADSTTPPSAIAGLKATLADLTAKRDAAHAVVVGESAAEGPALALYHRIQSYLDVTPSPWVIDHSEKLSDYGVHLGSDLALTQFLKQTYQTDPQSAAASVEVPIQIDHTFDGANAIAVDGTGGYAVIGSSNQYQRPDRFFASQLTYYDAQGALQWEDISQDFHVGYQSQALVATGPQSFALVGDDGAKHAVLRLVQGSAGATPVVSSRPYPEFTFFQSVARTAKGDLLVVGSNAQGSWAVLLSGQDGSVLHQARLFAEAGPVSVSGAIVTSTGAIVAYGDRGNYHRECLEVTGLTADLGQVSWQNEVCEPKAGFSAFAATATADGAFAVSGQIVRDVPQGDQADVWDIDRHRAFVFGFTAAGAQAFDYRSQEVDHWGWMGFQGLAFNARTGELAAVGSFPYAGEVDIFNGYGELLAHGTSHDHYNTQFSGVAVLADQSGFQIAGTEGDYPGSGFVSYNAVIGVVHRP